MIIKELDFSILNREEYIYIMQCIIYWFKLDFTNFTEEEENIIKNAIKKKEKESIKI